MDPMVRNGEKAMINVRDEREFKLWVKFIASVHKDGGDIRKPIDLLWKSFENEIKSIDKSRSTKRGSMSLS